MPTGSPMTMQNTSEVSTSDSVTMASGQMPSMATTTSETAAPMAMARPANCQATRVRIRISSGQGRASMASVMPDSVPSMGVRTAWKKGRKWWTTHSRPLLIQPCTGRPSVVNWCQRLAWASSGTPADAPSQSPPGASPLLAAPQGSGDASAGACVEVAAQGSALAGAAASAAAGAAFALAPASDQGSVAAAAVFGFRLLLASLMRHLLVVVRSAPRWGRRWGRWRPGNAG
ncbi:MAG: hypothetical protein GAK34_03857 [Delftia tsuruhatensis]|nr:MAG: hypothetical protein GAK34_03857 [Delftia tsuruhatensis]